MGASATLSAHKKKQRRLNEAEATATVKMFLLKTY